jgi:hypothetical protein
MILPGFVKAAFSQDERLDKKVIIRNQTNAKQNLEAKGEIDLEKNEGLQEKSDTEKKEEKLEDLIPDDLSVSDALSNPELGLKSDLTREDLIRLRTEDPDKYREITQKRRIDVLNRLELLKANNPQRFERIKERLEYKEKGRVGGSEDTRERRRYTR